MTIIFDFDGTLADSLEILLLAYNHIAEKHNLRHIDRKDWPSIRQMSFTQGLRYAGVKPYQLPGLLAEGKRNLLERSSEIKIFPGIEEVVTDLAERGNNLFVLSTNSQKLVEDVLSRSSLRQYLQILKSSKLFGKTQALKRFIRQNKLSLENVWMVGDELRDMQAARRCGIKFIGVTWGFQPEKISIPGTNTWVANDPSDISRIVGEGYD